VMDDDGERKEERGMDDVGGCQPAQVQAADSLALACQVGAPPAQCQCLPLPLPALALHTIGSASRGVM